MPAMAVEAVSEPFAVPRRYKWVVLAVPSLSKIAEVAREDRNKDPTTSMCEDFHDNGSLQASMSIA
jgi:hypothetical protein